MIFTTTRTRLGSGPRVCEVVCASAYLDPRVYLGCAFDRLGAASFAETYCGHGLSKPSCIPRGDHNGRPRNLGQTAP